jgi:hypothetical protein
MPRSNGAIDRHGRLHVSLYRNLNWLFEERRRGLSYGAVARVPGSQCSREKTKCGTMDRMRKFCSDPIVLFGR